MAPKKPDGKKPEGEGPRVYIKVDVSWTDALLVSPQLLFWNANRLDQFQQSYG